MKKRFLIVPLIVILILFALPAFSGAVTTGTVEGSYHDFSDIVPMQAEDYPASACLVCHNPHPSRNKDALRLWVRDLSAERATFSQTSTPNYLPFPNLLCFDCHSGTTADNDPDMASFSSTRTPADIAFSNDGTATNGVVGYYETDPPNTTPPTPSEIASGAVTGGHFIKTAPYSGAEAGDKLPCDACHSVHNSSEAFPPTNEAFINPVLAGKSVSGLKASPNTRHGTGTGREICTSCHGYSNPGHGDDTASVSLTQVFANIDSSVTGGEIVRRPNDIPSHSPSDPDQTPCTSCHSHNRIAPSCNYCHSYPPGSDQGTYKGSKTHNIHVNTYGFSCYKCHNAWPSGHNESGVTSKNDWAAKFDPANVDVVFDPSYNPSGTSTIVYSGTDRNRQCANLYCHGQLGSVNGVNFSSLGGTNQSGNIPTWDYPYNINAANLYPLTKVSGACGTCHDTTKDNQAQGGSLWPIWDSTNTANDWTTATVPKIWDVTQGSSIGDAVGDSHPTHLDKKRGPKAVCNSCHPTPPSITGAESTATPAKHVNTAFDFYDGTSTIAATGVCNICHSPGGGYNGVNSSGVSIGAKDNWATGVYDTTTTLKPGKAKWCVGCHDSQPAYIQSIYAPGVGGDAATYGFYLSGHGLTTTVQYDKDHIGDSAGNVGAGKECTICHDLTKEHINGQDDTNAAGQRLRSSINGTATPSVFAACKACHQINGGPDSADSTAQVSSHGNDTAEGFAPEEESYYKKCQTCHEVHGNNKNVQSSRNLKLIKSKINTSDVVFENTTGTDSFDEADTTDTDDICVTCHITSTNNPGYPMSNHQGGDHGWADQRGKNCTACHTHDYKQNGNVSPNDGFMPSCSGCHGFPPQQIGLDDTATRGYAGGIGAHQVHVDGAGFECKTCHGHNGSGPTHGGSVGRTVVEQKNINIVFDTGLSFPGGTTLYNGGAPFEDTSTPTNPTCVVGCHNPIIFYPENETTPNLVNVIGWDDGLLGAWPADSDPTTPDIPCKNCHDTQGTAMDQGTLDGVNYISSHKVDTSKRTDCLVCHDLSNHKNGIVVLKNNDNTSTVSWSRSLIVPDTDVFEPFCLSCHDADGNQPFSTTGTPPNIESQWSAAAHQTGGTTNAGYSCFGDTSFGGVGCHNNPHGSASVKLLTTKVNNSIDTICFNCHTQGKVQNNAISGATLADDIQQAFSFADNQKHTLGTTFRINGADNFTLQCTSCHNPHIVTGKYWEADTSKTPITTPNFSDPVNNPRGMGTQLWGAVSGQKMADYAGSGTYVTPKEETFTASQLPSYPVFCEACHTPMDAPELGTGGHGNIQFDSDPHGKGAANVPNGGGTVPDWGTVGKAESWNNDDAMENWLGGSSWPVEPRGKGEQIWTRPPFDQVQRIAGANFTLSCTNCHEAHGSNINSALRTNPNGGTGSTTWNTMCNNCHYYYSTWHNGMSCGNASCHVSDGSDRMYWTGTDSIHDMGNRYGDGSTRSFDPDLVGSWSFNSNLNDSGSWRMHGRWYDTAGTYAAGKSGNAVVLNGDQPIEIGTRDSYWSTDEGKHGTWKYSEMKYNTTVEAWVNLQDSANNEYIIGTKSPNYYNEGGYRLSIEKVSGTYRAVFHMNVDGTDSGKRGAYSTTVIPQNTWTHIAATFDTAGPDQDSNDPSVGRIRIYVNGADVTASNPTPGALLAQPGVGENYIYPFSDHNIADPGSWWGNGFTWGAIQWASGSRVGLIGMLDEAKLWNITKPKSYYSSIDAQFPPEISSAIGIDDKITVTFSEGVYSDSSATAALTPADFTLTDTNNDNTRTITSVSHNPGDNTAILTMSQPFIKADFNADTLAAATAGSIYDDQGTAMGTTPVAITRSSVIVGGTSFQLNEAAGSATATDEFDILQGAVSDTTETFLGDGYFHGDGVNNYIAFDNNTSALKADTKMSLEARIKPSNITSGTTSYIRRILDRADGGGNYQMSVWRNNSWATYNAPDGVASIAFWLKPQDSHGGLVWKLFLTDYTNYPIVSDHWYKVRAVWNSAKTGGIPGDIFVDDQGTDGSGTAENWSGYANATDFTQSQLPSNRYLYERDKITAVDGVFTIGVRVNNHSNNLFDGLIDWISWKDFADYNGLSNTAKGTGIKSAIAFDASGAGAGIQPGDKIELKFSQPTQGNTINAGNIDTALALNNGHSWLDGLSGIGSAVWSSSVYANDTLSITLSTTAGTPTVSLADLITPDGTIKDAAGNPISDTQVIGGNFDSLISGAIGYWNMAENTSDTAYDATVNENHGALFGTTTWTAGQSDPALQFTAVGDYLEIPDSNNSLDLTNQGSLEVWAKKNANSSDQVYISKYNLPNEMAYEMADENGYVVVRWGDGITTYTLKSLTTVAVGTWNHIVATYDGSVMKIYINGVLDNFISYSGSALTNDYPLYIGARGGSGAFFKGIIDQAAIYNRALNATETN